jgi:DNA helicase-2/ATP-dependent DNA helicase PcrA
VNACNGSIHESVSLLNSQSKFFANGVVLTTASLAKGLQIDQVLVPWCTKANYRQAIDRRMLYVAVTRDTHCLVLTHCEAITDILPSVCTLTSVALNQEKFA